MKVDINRETFVRARHFARVLSQQGRVLLPSDVNEQTAILLHYVRTVTCDLVGPFAGPARGSGFKIASDVSGGVLKDLLIGAGRYYVDGILCESEPPVKENAWKYSNQPDYPLDSDEVAKSLKSLPSLVYLDVWERPITILEDDSIREAALGLGGPDTCARSKIVWQVRILPDTNLPACPEGPSWLSLVEQLRPANRGLLRARVKPEDPSTEPCITSPEARYRGVENQLYRVEILTGGVADTEHPTFVWSRDNGTVSFAIRALTGDRCTLESLGRDPRRTVTPGDWVEITDDRRVLRGEPGAMAKIAKVNRDDLEATLQWAKESKKPEYDKPDLKWHPILRRWDHAKGAVDPDAVELDQDRGAIRVVEAAGQAKDKWIPLEDGIEIQFKPAEGGAHEYRTGDYWLIPARVATGEIEWPHEGAPGGESVPAAKDPDGVEHHYAPLAIIGATGTASDCRRCFSITPSQCP